MTTNEELKLMLAHQGGLLEDVHTVVFGDGDPHKGMVVRLALVERFQTVLRKAIWIAVGALITGGIGYFIFR